MKSILAVIFGFGLSLFIEGFARIIISFFHTMEASFFGILALPGISWIIIIYVVSFVSSWLGCMMAMTIANGSITKVIIAFISLVFLWSVFEALASLNVSPGWYLVSFPITSIIGALTASYTYKLNLNAISTS